MSLADQVLATVRDASTVEYDLEHFVNTDRLADGQCCGHYHARQSTDRLDTIDSQPSGIEPVEELFSIYAELINKLIGITLCN